MVRSPAHCLDMTMQMIDWCGTAAAQQWAETVHESFPATVEVDPRGWVNSLNGVTWWVSAAISQLVLRAQADIPEPDGPVGAENVPAPTGVIWFHSAPFGWGFGDRQLVAISWIVATIDGRSAAVIIPWENEPTSRTPIPQIPTVLPLGNEAAQIAVTELTTPDGVTDWDAIVDAAWAHEEPHMARILLTAWVLGRARLPRHIESAPRALRRRRARMEPAPVPGWDEIRVTTLRRQPESGSGEPAEEGRFHHQWIVSGHWRWQPCGPDRSERRLVWVSPHIKGPEGAPFIAPDKAAKLVR